MKRNLIRFHGALAHGAKNESLHWREVQRSRLVDKVGLVGYPTLYKSSAVCHVGMRTQSSVIRREQAEDQEIYWVGAENKKKNLRAMALFNSNSDPWHGPAKDAETRLRKRERPNANVLFFVLFFCR